MTKKPRLSKGKETKYEYAQSNALVSIPRKKRSFLFLNNSKIHNSQNSITNNSITQNPL